MFDTIILLTGPVEEAALAAVLRRYNPRLDIRAADSLAELDALDAALLRRARLIGFVTPVIVPALILKRLGFGAYNFHPGPPHYPGWVPSHFAIYDQADYFGVTAHAMIDKVDAGPIVGVDMFAIPPDSSVTGLEQLALVKLARVFWNLAEALATRSEPLPELPIKWGGRKSTRRMYQAMCDIPAGIEKADLERRIKAFGGGHFGLSPAITLHGHRFCYVAPETQAPANVPEPRVTEPA
jgi:methionyl-tRNA formyltransferase